MKRSLIPAAILAGLTLAGNAAAHTPEVVPSCTGITITLTNYEGTATNNSVTISLDGAPPGQALFGSSYTHTFQWSPAQNHTYSVVIDANLHTGNPTQYDKTFQGAKSACGYPTTTADPTTTVAETTAPPATDATTTVAATADPTTTDVAVGVPPVPPTTISFIVEPELPRTGSNPAVMIAAMLLITAGAITLVLVRRNP